MKQNEELSMNMFSLRLIGWISLLWGFADAFWLYLASTYIKDVTGSENVSLFYVPVFLAVIGVLFVLHELIRWLGKTTFLSILLFILSVGAIYLSVVPASWAGLVVLALLFLSMNVGWVALDAVLEDFSRDAYSGRIRGMHLTVMNIGILIAPFLATRILDQYGFPAIFFGSALIYMAIFIFTVLGFRRINYRFKEKIAPMAIIRKVRRMPDILRIYAVSFVLESFYAAMTVYLPFRLLDLGFSWLQIGSMYTIMLIPFVVIQYPIGLIADRYSGEREMLLGALVILMISTATVALLVSSSFWWWAAVLFITRIGAASVEVLRDSYFYKHVDGEDGDLIAFFRTSRPAAAIVSSLLMAGLLLFFPVASVFWLVVLLTFGGFFVALRMRDVRG